VTCFCTQNLSVSGSLPVRSAVKSNLTAWCNQMLSDRTLNASTWSFQIFSTFAIVDPTQPNPTHQNWKISTQPNPWTTLEVRIYSYKKATRWDGWIAAGLRLYNACSHQPIRGRFSASAGVFASWLQGVSPSWYNSTYSTHVTRSAGFLRAEICIISGHDAAVQRVAEKTGIIGY